MRRPQKPSNLDTNMKYYSRKRIVLSIIASVVLLIIVAAEIAESRDAINAVVGGLLAGVALLAVLLPKIWWNFLLDRIREIAKAIKNND